MSQQEEDSTSDAEELESVVPGRQLRNVLKGKSGKKSSARRHESEKEKARRHEKKNGSVERNRGGNKSSIIGRPDPDEDSESDQKSTTGSSTDRAQSPSTSAPSTIEQCIKCKQPLEEKIKLAFGNLYHADCFRCTSCNSKMNRYVVHEGKPYCLLCTRTMFEARCAECGSWLFGRKSEGKPPVFALGHVYHSRCFQCATCQKRIFGKFFISDLDKIYCPDHPPEGTPDELKKLCNTPAKVEEVQYMYEEEPTVLTATDT